VVSYFAAIIAIGAAAGLWRISRPGIHVQAVHQVFGSDANHRLNAGLLVLLSALIGSRAGYVLVNWGYFQAHPWDAFQLWLGGLAWPGALLGGLLALGGLALAWRRPAGALADALFPLLAPVVVAAWLGGWQAGSFYGPALAAPTGWAVLARDELGQMLYRWPLQPAAALLSLAVLGLAERFGLGRLPPGRAASLGWLGMCLLLLGLTFIRVDPAPLWNGLRLDAWAASGLVILALALFGLSFLPARKSDPPG
jgi:phosphatidylglycerol---prolipoprotein diacylglyceryl transferase